MQGAKSDSLLRVYLAGHCGWRAPGWVRILPAGSELHRVWLYGRLAVFVENGMAYEPANHYGLRTPESRPDWGGW